MDLLRVKATELGLPLVRPLPTIFAYAKRAQTVDLIPNVLEEEFYAHVDCLNTLIETACLRSGVPASACEEVSQRVVELSRAEKSDLPSAVNDLLTHLSRLSGIHKTTIKKELALKPQVYRDIFWGRVYTKKITLVHQDDSAESVAKMERSLRETCMYDVTTAAEKELVLKPMSSDFVIFRPTQGPIRQATLAAANSLGIPILTLMDLGTKVETADPVMVRTALLYKKSGMNVLHRPFTPLRLFTAIDARYVDHLFERPAFAGARSQKGVA